MENVLNSLTNNRFLQTLGVGIDAAKPMTQQEREQEKADAYNAESGNLDKEDGYQCDLCRNRGNIAIVAQNETFGYYYEALKPCKCTRIRNALRRLNKSGLKNVVKEYTFDLYQTPEEWQRDIKQKAMRFCQDSKSDWFFLGGQSGAGKSHIGTAIAVHYIRQGLDAIYMQWLDDIDRLKNLSISKETEKYDATMKSLKESPVLYIDDLFKAGNGVDTSDTPFSQIDVKRTFEIINYRYNNPGLITIISSEKTIMQMADIDQALAGRIAERTQTAGYCCNIRSDIHKNWRLKNLIEY